jgi:hypothetical protein
MYYSEIDPRTMKRVFVAKTAEEKAMQRALLQWRRPDKRPIVLAALRKAGREDLIGYGRECLLRPGPDAKAGEPRKTAPKKNEKPAEKKAPLVRKKGWAKPKTSAKNAKPGKPKKKTGGK